MSEQRIVEDYREITKGNWHTKTYDLNNPVHMARYIARNQYAWPGGYELCGVTSDGALLCSNCVKEEYVTIHHSTKHAYNDGWQIVAIISEAELESVNCSHCNKELGY